MKSIEFGTHLPVIGFGGQETISREQSISFAQKTEELGYDSLSVNDHVIYRTAWLDAICSLLAIAATTHRIKIGTSILNIVVRNPVVCAKYSGYPIKISETSKFWICIEGKIYGKPESVLDNEINDLISRIFSTRPVTEKDKEIIEDWLLKTDGTI